jgi:hypothetical protein
MNGLANAACRRRSGGSQSQRDEVSREREEQQKFGDPTMHTKSMHTKSAVLEAYQLAAGGATVERSSGG